MQTIQIMARASTTFPQKHDAGIRVQQEEQRKRLDLAFERKAMHFASNANINPIDLDCKHLSLTTIQDGQDTLQDFLQEGSF